MARTRRAMPPVNVLAAFGINGDVEPLPGGQDRAWRSAGVVLKPAGIPDEVNWRAEVLAALPESAEFRVARPIPTLDGRWVASGWEAWREVAGEPDPTRCEEILRAGEAFHAALSDLPRPGFLDVRRDPWTYGERVAWQELPVADGTEWTELLHRLAEVRRPVAGPAQPVHGDLPGNVLFAAGLPPAVIDWAVYFRPASWASAVAVADLVTWHGAPSTLLGWGARLAHWDQLLVRALMYRIATNEGCRRSGLPVREHPNVYDRVVASVLARVNGGRP